MTTKHARLACLNRFLLVLVALVVTMGFRSRFSPGRAAGRAPASGFGLSARVEEFATFREMALRATRTEAETAAKASPVEEPAYESVQAALHAARYAMTKIDPAGPHSRGAEYFASNPKQHLRAWFSQTGIELAAGSSRRRAAAAPPGPEPEAWSLALRLHAAGQADAPAAGIRASGDRVEMAGLGSGVTQWFQNREEGIEQGFQISSPGPGNGVLEVALSVEGTLHPERLPPDDETAGGIQFVRPGGASVVRYTGLTAWDATGRGLPAQTELRGTELIIRVADEGAQYPVTIDPLFANADARLTEVTGLDDYFGDAIASNGDTVVIGAPNAETVHDFDAGAAFVFVRNGSLWALQARLVASDGKEGDLFGNAVALDGTSVVIGAPRGGAAGGRGGCAYLYRQTGGNWAEAQKLVPSTPVNDAQFGFSVALTGTRLVLGSPQWQNASGVRTGACYSFTASGANFLETGHFTGSTFAEGDRFGESIALSGPVLLAGAPLADSAPRDGGAAFFFRDSGSGWTEEANLHYNNSSGHFGSSVSLDGDLAAIGAEVADSSRAGQSGLTFVFRRVNNTWQYEATLSASNGATGDAFGHAVSVQGSTIVTGARLRNTAAGYRAGSAYVHTYSGSWSESAILVPSDATAEDWFGSAVCLAGGRIFIGARYGDNGSAVDTGSVAVFGKSGAAWVQEARLTAAEEPGRDHLGTSVAISGATAIAGANFDDGPAGENTGSVYVFVRNARGWVEEAKLFAPDARPFDYLGESVALEGDTMVIGSAANDVAGENDAGAAYVFVRNAGAWAFQAKLAAADYAHDSRFGASVAIAGPIIAVGAVQGASPLAARAGAVYVFAAQGGSWSQQSKLYAPDGAADEKFGNAVSLAGTTVLAGCSYHNSTAGSHSGKAYVFVRSGTTWNLEAGLTAPDAFANANFGGKVSLHGETAVIAGPGVSNANGGLSAAYVYVRQASAWRLQARLPIPDTFAYSEGSLTVAISGDRVVAGSIFADPNGRNSEGEAFLFERHGEEWTLQTRINSGSDASSYDYFGGAVAIDGSLALVAATNEDFSGVDSGAVYAYLIGELPRIITQPIPRTVVPGTPVSFSVEGTGDAPLRYQWRKDGFEISGANGPTLTVQVPVASPFDAVQGTYDVVISNAGGVVTSAPALLSVNALSRFAQATPKPAPPAKGFLLVNLTPPELLDGRAGWRFVGEQGWRVPGVPVGGLASGSREIEFRPVAGYHQPLRDSVLITSGTAAAVVEREYLEADAAGGTGELRVILKPDSIAGPSVPPAERAQWRLLRVGDADPDAPGYATDANWRDSGEAGKLTGLRPGFYLVECKRLANRSTDPKRLSTPPALSVKVLPPTAAGGVRTATAIGTYYAADAPGTLRPSVIPFETVSADPTLPYAFVGQIRSEIGVSSGFVVTDRVVATAGHVVFDELKMTAVAGLQWLFQRDRQTYEPKPQEPRGFYMLDGYASARDPALHPAVVPGEGTELSQHYDVAALYFVVQTDPSGNVLDDGLAGRGGGAGYLASDSPLNEWLLSAERKTLAGYPVDGIAPENQGRLHATTPADVHFAPVPGEATAGHPYRTYTTGDLTASGGCSGGPLCVEYFDGSAKTFYPAAVYLGGSDQTVVRAIDGDVVEMFERARKSGNSEPNNTGGGITRVDSTGAAANFDFATVQVTIEPAAARNAGGGWRLKGSGAYSAGGAVSPPLQADSYTLQFATIPGFEVPIQPTVTLTNGSNNYIYTYARPSVPNLGSAKSLSGLKTVDFLYLPTVTGGAPVRFDAGVGDGETLDGLGLTLDPSTGRLSGRLTKAGTFTIVLTASNTLGVSDPLVLTLTVGEPGVLTVQFRAERGTVKLSPPRPNNTYAQGEHVTLTAKVSSSAFLFSGWQFDGLAEDDQPDATMLKTSVKMTAGIVATAQFVANPFLELNGSFMGRVAPAMGPRPADSGTLSLQLGRLGSFTGTLRVGSTRAKVKGRFAADGTARVLLKGAGDLTLDLDLTPANTGRITGALTTNGIAIPLTLEHAVFRKGTNVAPQKGAYTLLWKHPVPAGGNPVPEGDGFATLTVAENGSLHLAGELGDGTKISQGGLVAQGGRWVFYTVLYHREGMLTGDVTFRAVAGVSDVEGVLDWVKPPLRASGVTYPAGFATQTAVLGARYDRTARLEFTSAHVSLIEQGAVVDGPIGLVVDASARTLRTSGLPLSFKFIGRTGLFSGKSSTSGAARSFRGALLHKTGFGWYLAAPPLTGRVELLGN